MNRIQNRFFWEFCLIAVLTMLGLTGCLLLYFGHPAEYVWLPSCPFRAWTGLYCPGCGTLRATHYFLNGELYVAFRHQPLLFCLLPLLTLLACKAIGERVRNRSMAFPFEWQLYWLMLIAVCLFFVLRNIPLDCFECLRPPSR